jgi:hypothetical protein
MNIDTCITPHPSEISQQIKMEYRRQEWGSNLGQVAYVVRPSNNYGTRIDEIVTYWHGKKYVHRFFGDVRRAMEMVRLSIGAQS